jgi:peptidoglycan hydrolase CwlO-like protein
MATAELLFGGQTFQISIRSLVSTCELFVENIQLLMKPYQVRSQKSETNFRLCLAAIEGATTEIGIENALDIESLSSEFQFVELGRKVTEFISQHPHIEVIRLKSAITGLHRRLARQDRELCQLAETNGQQDSQVQDVRGVIGEVEKKQQHECTKVSGLQEAMENIRRSISQTNEAVDRRIGSLERAAF